MLSGSSSKYTSFRTSCSRAWHLQSPSGSLQRKWKRDKPNPQHCTWEQSAEITIHRDESTNLMLKNGLTFVVPMHKRKTYTAPKAFVVTFPSTWKTYFEVAVTDAHFVHWKHLKRKLNALHGKKVTKNVGQWKLTHLPRGFELSSSFWRFRKCFIDSGNSVNSVDERKKAE